MTTKIFEMKRVWNPCGSNELSFLFSISWFLLNELFRPIPSLMPATGRLGGDQRCLFTVATLDEYFFREVVLIKLGK